MTTAEALDNLRRAVENGAKITAEELGEMRESLAYLVDAEKERERLKKQAAEEARTTAVAEALLAKAKVAADAILDRAGVAARNVENEMGRPFSNPGIETRLSGTHRAIDPVVAAAADAWHTKAWNVAKHPAFYGGGTVLAVLTNIIHYIATHWAGVVAALK